MKRRDFIRTGDGRYRRDGRDGRARKNCGGVPACANVDYSEPLAEIALLGNIAVLAGLKHRVTEAPFRTTMPR